MLNKSFQMDEIDRKIVKIVQEHPTITHTKIAQKVERSQPTIGLRIKKLRKNGILEYQAGMNLRTADVYLGRVDMNTDNPDKYIELVDECQYIINAYRISGKNNLSILIAHDQIDEIEKIVNNQFRNKLDVSNVTLNIISQVAKDFILPVESE
ncbi:MAG: Lrp/AsnC family transcriptional regulator [Promethearchaeia archaeon]